MRTHEPGPLEALHAEVLVVFERHAAERAPAERAPGLDSILARRQARLAVAPLLVGPAHQAPASARDVPQPQLGAVHGLAARVDEPHAERMRDHVALREHDVAHVVTPEERPQGAHGEDDRGVGGRVVHVQLERPGGHVREGEAAVLVGARRVAPQGVRARAPAPRLP